MKITVVKSASAVMMIIGCVSLIGWLADIPALVQVSPRFSSIHYNTALVFIITGAALFSLPARPKLATFVGIVAILFGGVALFEAVSGIDTGLNSFLPNKLLTVRAIHLGGVAPNTGLCFVLLGLSLLFSGRTGKTIEVMAILGSLVASLGAVAFFGYLSGMERAYGWGTLTRMALFTSVAMTAAGTAVVFHAAAAERRLVGGYPCWLPKSVFVAAVTATVIIWQANLTEPLGIAFLLTGNLQPPSGMLGILLSMATALLLSFLLAKVTDLAQRYRCRAEELAQTNCRLESEIDKQVSTALELSRANRSLLVLSRCNMAIVHAREEHQLLAEICGIIVESGGYRMAWIAYADDDPAVPVRKMASSGDDGGYLDTVTVTWDNTPTGNGPTGKAIKTGKPSITRNIFNDPDYCKWREKALLHGFASSIALPFREADNLRGSLNIYAVEEDAFDEAETLLLTELAVNISFGVNALKSDCLRAKAEQSLREREKFLAEILDSIRDGILVFDSERRVIRGNSAILEWFAADLPLEGKLCCDLFQKRCHTCPTGRALRERINTSEIVAAADGSWLDIHAFPLHDKGVILYVRDVSEMKRTEDELVQEKNKWEAIVGAIGEGLTIQDRDFRVVYQNDVHVRRHGHHVGESCQEAYGCNEGDGCPLKGSFDSKKPVTQEKQLPSGKEILDLEITASPLRDTTGEIIAGIEIMCDISDRKRAERQIRKQLESISAMRNIDLAISATGDLRVTLNILLNHVRAQLFVDAATVLLVNSVSNTLETAAAEGFFNPEAISTSCVPIGAGFAGKAAQERRSFHHSRLKPTEVTFALQEEGFVAYHAIPLFSKGLVTGVMELFHRSPFVPDSEWKSLAEAMAGQASIAIDNARMFDALQRSNAGLIAAYDATIVALSRALDFRDHETEGHSRRVTEMTVRISKEMNISDEELYHIRRGALLHDIGKLAIPDHILLKPGALAAEEKQIMERHPDIAHDMLSPISFLRPALDIPYCHHEKWDGTGYPRGLRGEQIPFSARIFAAVDIWDALRSDRPYRQAWDVEKTRDYLCSIAGTHLDPDVVEVFLRVNLSSIP